MADADLSCGRQVWALAEHKPGLIVAMEWIDGLLWYTVKLGAGKYVRCTDHTLRPL